MPVICRWADARHQAGCRAGAQPDLCGGGAGKERRLSSLSPAPGLCARARLLWGRGCVCVCGGGVKPSAGEWSTSSVNRGAN